MDVLAIHGSYHRNGNISKLVDLALEGAKNVGAKHTEKITLLNKNIQFCQNCKICFDNMGSNYNTYRCPTPDEMQEIIDRIDRADHLILASPINIGSVTAIFKRFAERCIAASNIIKIKEAKEKHPELVTWITSIDKISPIVQDLPIYLPRKPLTAKRKCIVITSAMSPIEMAEKVPVLDRAFGVLEDTAKILGFPVFRKVAGIGVTIHPVGVGNPAEKLAYEAGKSLGSKEEQVPSFLPRFASPSPDSSGYNTR